MGSCLEFTSKCGTVFLAVLNIVATLLGVGLMVVGIILREEINEESDVLDFLHEVDFGSITLKQIVEIVFIAVIVIGVFITLTALSGCIGAICKVRVLLIIYVIILILCITLELVILGFWVTLIQGTNSWLKGEFNDLLADYAGPASKEVISVGWNLIFILFNCCGVEPVTSSNNDFQTLPSDWWATRGSDVIPASCCKDVSRDNYESYSNPQCTQTLQNYNTSGCYDAFQDLFQQLGAVAIAVIAIMLLVEVLAIIFSIVIVYRETKKKSSQVV